MRRLGSGRSTRALLATIGLLAILLGGGRSENNRRRVYQDRLDYHRQRLHGSPSPATWRTMDQLLKEDQDRIVRAWSYHAAMSQKYQLALSIPWYRVPPDPPEPAIPRLRFRGAAR
ncbi:MAG: hypothetical protein AB7I30_21485 [Isosphaeraceae bacterium]